MGSGRTRYGPVRNPIWTHVRPYMERYRALYGPRHRTRYELILRPYMDPYKALYEPMYGPV
jgi:hypothetical protein